MSDRYRATYMRGGTSKGVFFDPADLPADNNLRDSIILRALGSPDRYSTQMDGMGGGSSSTSKAALVSPSTRPDCDLDYLVAAVPIGEPFVDWSGNCGNLASAVAAFAIHRGMLGEVADGIARIVIWQVNTQKRIIAHVPVAGGRALEAGAFSLDGVAFPGSEVRLDFEAGFDEKPLFPMNEPISTIAVPGEEAFKATLIDAGSPTILIHAHTLGLNGTERPDQVNSDTALLVKAEQMRASAAVAMDMASSVEEVSRSLQQSPKIVFINAPSDFVSPDGKLVRANSINLVARTFSMGKLHHAMTGTGTVALAAAAAVPGTIVSSITGVLSSIMIGHASGIVEVGSKAIDESGQWRISSTSFSRTARILMDGDIFIPSD